MSKAIYSLSLTLGVWSESTLRSGEESWQKSWVSWDERFTYFRVDAMCITSIKTCTNIEQTI